MLKKKIKQLDENDLIICVLSSLKHSWPNEPLENRKRYLKLFLHLF